jgi:hypothetical protein
MSINEDQDTGTPGDMAILSVECDEQKINHGDEISFCIYKKGTIPNGINKTDEGTGTKERGKSKVECNWYYKYEDPDYPAVNNTGPSYFFEAYSNCMDVVTSGKEFTTKWLRIDNARLNQLEGMIMASLQQQQKIKLKTLFNNKTNKLAEIIYDNRNALDGDSKKYLDGSANEAKQKIQSILDDITVYRDIDPTLMGNVFTNAGLSPDRFLDGLTIGSNIYVKQGQIPSVFLFHHRIEAAFLGHEAIHAIQARAFETTAGDRERKARFITFCANNAYKAETNRYEEVAYRFGGRAEPDFYLEQSGIRRPAPSIPILEDPATSVFWY